MEAVHCQGWCFWVVQSHCPRDLGGTMHMHYDKQPTHTFIVRLPLRQTIGSPLEKMILMAVPIRL